MGHGRWVSIFGLLAEAVIIEISCPAVRKPVARMSVIRSIPPMLGW